MLTQPNRTTISASGSIISYQGYLEKDVLSRIGVFTSDKSSTFGEYTYAYNQNFTKYQILGLLEDSVPVSFVPNLLVPEILVPNAYANTSKLPYTVGNRVGIVFDGNNIPIQNTVSSLDLITNSTFSGTVYLDNTGSGKIVGTGSSLYQSIGMTSCLRLQDMGNRKSGVYTINPTGTGNIQVYCDMVSDGGGWTLLGSYNATGLAYSSGSIGNPTDFLNQTGWKLSDVSTNAITLNYFKFQSLGGKNCKEYLYCKKWKFDYSGMNTTNNITTCSRTLDGSFIPNSGHSQGYPISHWQARDVWLRSHGNSHTRWQTESGTPCVYNYWKTNNAYPDILMWGK